MQYQPERSLGIWCFYLVVRASPLARLSKGFPRFCHASSLITVDYGFKSSTRDAYFDYHS